MLIGQEFTAQLVVIVGHEFLLVNGYFSRFNCPLISGLDFRLGLGFHRIVEK